MSKLVDFEFFLLFAGCTKLSPWSWKTCRRHLPKSRTCLKLSLIQPRRRTKERRLPTIWLCWPGRICFFFKAPFHLNCAMHIDSSNICMLIFHQKTYLHTRNLPGVARVKTLICKKANATNFLPSLMYDRWTHIGIGEHFRETILDYVMLNLWEGCSYNKY